MWRPVAIDLGVFQGIESRWVIREFRTSDRTSLVRAANNGKVADQLRDRFPHPYTADHAREWLDRVQVEDPVSHFAIGAGDEVAGSIGLQLQSDVHLRVAELGYWLAEPYWGRGIATRAVIAFTEFAFERYRLIRIYATVFETNPASARVLEKAGYLCEGRLRMSVVKHGRVLDQLLYSKLNPPAPR